ncbi:hypothetical protein I4U23_004539 [Adineta vaga]|nr:hypothetical protein I4U23_004539 [Adineta vaga]
MGNDASKDYSGKLSKGEIAVIKENSKLNESRKKIKFIEEYLKNTMFSSSKQFQQGGGAGDGKITKEEFHKYYKKVAGHIDKDGILADNTFAAFDTNHDGYINFTEFTFAILAQNKKDIDSVLDFSFELMDTSGDGQLSFDELKNYLEKAIILIFGRRISAISDSNQIAENIFQEFGRNKTQKLNKQQFIQGCKKNKDFAKLFTGSE